MHSILLKRREFPIWIAALTIVAVIGVFITIRYYIYTSIGKISYPIAAVITNDDTTPKTTSEVIEDNTGMPPSKF